MRRERRRLAGDAVVEPEPTLISTSQRWMARFTCTQPCIPGMPSESGWSCGNAPSPCSVVMTGMPVCSANAMQLRRRAGLDHRRCPTRSSGRSAFAISSAAACTGAGVDVGDAMVVVALEVERHVPVGHDARLLRVLRDVDRAPGPGRPVAAR